jgi:hypothetical protein
MAVASVLRTFRVRVNRQATVALGTGNGKSPSRVTLQPLTGDDNAQQNERYVQHIATSGDANRSDVEIQSFTVSKVSKETLLNALPN